LFAKEGAYVALVDRDGAGLQETLTAIEGAKGEATAHVGDVATLTSRELLSLTSSRGAAGSMLLMTAAGISAAARS